MRPRLLTLALVSAVLLLPAASARSQPATTTAVRFDRLQFELVGEWTQRESGSAHMVGRSDTGDVAILVYPSVDVLTDDFRWYALGIARKLGDTGKPDFERSQPEPQLRKTASGLKLMLQSLVVERNGQPVRYVVFTFLAGGHYQAVVVIGTDAAFREYGSTITAALDQAKAVLPPQPATDGTTELTCGPTTLTLPGAWRVGDSGTGKAAATDHAAVHLFPPQAGHTMSLADALNNWIATTEKASGGKTVGNSEYSPKLATINGGRIPIACRQRVTRFSNGSVFGYLYLMISLAGMYQPVRLAVDSGDAMVLRLPHLMAALEQAKIRLPECTALAGGTAVRHFNCEFRVPADWKVNQQPDKIASDRIELATGGGPVYASIALMTIDSPGLVLLEALERAMDEQFREMAESNAKYRNPAPPEVSVTRTADGQLVLRMNRSHSWRGFYPVETRAVGVLVPGPGCYLVLILADSQMREFNMPAFTEAAADMQRLAATVRWHNDDLSRREDVEKWLMTTKKVFDFRDRGMAGDFQSGVTWDTKYIWTFHDDRTVSTTFSDTTNVHSWAPTYQPQHHSNFNPASDAAWAGLDATNPLGMYPTFSGSGWTADSATGRAAFQVLTSDRKTWLLVCPPGGLPHLHRLVINREAFQINGYNERSSINKNRRDAGWNPDAPDFPVAE